MLVAFNKEDSATNTVLFLTLQDIMDLQRGKGREVDESQLANRSFNRITLMFYPTEAACRQAMADAGIEITEGMSLLPTLKPIDGQCSACRALVPCGELLEKRCIHCWKDLAINLLKMAN